MHKPYIIAEISANHNKSFEKAKELILASHQAGVDAVKLQTYTPDTITINSDKEHFVVKSDNEWNGLTLHEVYEMAYTPWEWQADLKAYADSIGVELFSTPFDETSVEFLESIEVPRYKVASPEIIDIPLLECIGNTKKPVIMSTGMASLGEIEEAVQTLRDSGTKDITLLKCTSAYPAKPEEMNLRTMVHMGTTFGCKFGLSDHTIGPVVPIAAATLGASVIEKHITFSRDENGPDSFFSSTPAEFKEMVDSIDVIYSALGEVTYGPVAREINNQRSRRSIFFIQDMNAGDLITPSHVKSVRPGFGLHPRYLKEIIGMKVTEDVECGDPVGWGLIQKNG